MAWGAVEGERAVPSAVCPLRPACIHPHGLPSPNSFNQLAHRLGLATAAALQADVCLALGWAGPLSPMARLLRVSPFGRSSADQESGSGSGSRGNVIAGGSAGAPDPCLSSAVAAYLNRPEAQRALHANTSGVLPYRWTYCTGRVQYDE